VFGEVPPGQALLRSGARVGDDIYVSGTLGDARLALDALMGNTVLPAEVLASVRIRLEQPTPRVALGMALRGVASGAADVSDGLLGDLGHILTQSGVGATIDAESAMQLLAARAYSAGASGTLDTIISLDQLLGCVLGGGDDYELVFTVTPANRPAVEAASRSSNTPVTRIGRVVDGAGIRVVGSRGQELDTSAWRSFDHFQ
jgi:thiamine-monophosphate kinase